MKTKISVGALLATTVLAISLSAPQAFAHDEVKPPAKVATIDSSRLSPDMTEIAKLVQSGVDEKVLLAYIQSSPAQRSPTADELVYLHDLGLSSQAMVALLNSAKRPAATMQATTAQPQAAPVQTTVQSSAAAPQVIYTQPPVVYAPPAVVYEPAWRYPAFSFGFDFGHHIFDHHFGGHHDFGHFGGHHGGHH